MGEIMTTKTRKAFLKLPVKQRRKILENQTDRLLEATKQIGSAEAEQVTLKDLIRLANGTDTELVITFKDRTYR
jgi:16S rRNA A1518/A1519 N6-dimethyltransferase RsmA/KsgA/DIM1 with predicted DNA glycosylase/AP lyase activity